MKNSIYRVAVTSLIFITIALQNSNAQNKYIDRSGKIQFEASEALFEEVKAANESVTSVLDIKTGQIAALALIKGFHFKNSLMEEHFNENYIESGMYPKATFKGQFADLDLALLDENTKKAEIEGTLKLHGKEKEVRTQISIQKVGNIISMTGEFVVTPRDFDIHIPKIVQNKIAKEVLVKFDFKLIKK